MKLCEYFLNEEFNKLTHMNVINGINGNFKFEIIGSRMGSKMYSLVIKSTSSLPQIHCEFYSDQTDKVGFFYVNTRSFCGKGEPGYTDCIESIAEFCEEFAPFELKELLRNLLECQL